MPAFRIQGFAGIVPRLDPRLLGENQAQIAVNCDLTSGDIIPLMGGLTVIKPNISGEIKSFYRMVDGANEHWLAWLRDVDVARGPIAGDTLQRTYWTGDGEPRMSTLAEIISGGGNDYPKNFFVLGVTPPTVAPTVGHTGGAAANETREYLLTFVTPYGEESAPSPVGSHTAPSDATSWDLSALETAPPNTFTVTAASWSAGIATLTVASTRGLRIGEEFSVTGIDPSGYNTPLAAITALTATTISYALASNPGAYVSGGDIGRIALHNISGMVKRIYRTVTSVNTVDFFFVDEIPVAQTTYTDTIANSVVTGQGTLKTLGWDMPPVNLHSLTELTNGMMAGISRNTVRFSEPYAPYAWPTAYEQAMAYDGVSLGAYGQNLVATTIADPYLFTGTHPSTMSSMKVDGDYPSVCKRGVRQTLGGVLYPTHSGMALTGQSGTNIVTLPFYTQKEWKRLQPSTFIAAVHQDRYYAAFTDAEGKRKVWIFDPREIAQVIEANVSVTEFYTDYLSGNLYFTDGSTIYQWDADDAVKPLFDWWSREFVFTPPVNMAAAKIDVDFDTSAEESAALQAVRDAIILANKVLIGSDNYQFVGNTTNTSKVVTGLSSTKKLFKWMNVSGTGIPAGTKIASIDDISTITLTQAATVTGSPTLTFTGDLDSVDGAFNSVPFNTYAFNASAMQEIPEITYDYLQFTLYTDRKVKFSKHISTSKAFRLPQGYKSDNLSVRLAGNVRVKGVVVGTSMNALKEA